ncbi:MAG: translation initiation factor [Planctomycetaceae bacterium]|nr:translation initiation factor [Planctomycetaceae bacterium]
MGRLFAGTQWDVPPRCDRCGALEAECRCPPPPAPARESLPPNKQSAKLAVEKRTGGRFVTVVRGLAAADNDFPGLVGQLKAACGAGGTHKDDTIEIQGKHLDAVRAALERIGYRVKG